MLPAGSRERLLAGGALLLVIGAVFFAGSRYARQSPPIEIKSLAPAPSASPPGEASKSLRIDVEGAVAHPGLLTLNGDPRVSDAIEAAGGKLADADTDDLNLAAKLSDGTQLFVPHKAKPDEKNKVSENYRGGPDAPSTYSAHPRSHASSHGGGKHPSSPVSLNTGTEDQLESLPGIGPSTAKKILDYRQEHGGFSSIDELMAVKGIGPKKLKAMRQWLRL